MLDSVPVDGDAIFSSVYFGEIPYYQELAKHSSVFIDLFERYKKQTWRSRTQILTGNGSLTLSVPVKRIHGKQTLMKDAIISNETDWRKDHWKAIESAYMHAPYFFYYGDQIKALIYSDIEHLFELNQLIFAQVVQWLDLSITIKYTRRYVKQDPNTDYRLQLEKKTFNHSSQPYIQVFSDKAPFVSNLSIIDLLMNQGPLARKWLTNN